MNFSSVWSSLGDALGAALTPGYSDMYMRAMNMRMQQQEMNERAKHWAIENQLRQEQMGMNREYQQGQLAHMKAMEPTYAAQVDANRARALASLAGAGLDEQKTRDLADVQTNTGSFGEALKRYMLARSPVGVNPQFEGPTNRFANIMPIDVAGGRIGGEESRLMGEATELAIKANPQNPQRAAKAMQEFIMTKMSGIATDPRAAQLAMGGGFRPLAVGANRAEVLYPGTGEVQPAGRMVIGPNQTVFNERMQPVAEGATSVPAGGEFISRMTGQQTINPIAPRMGNDLPQIRMLAQFILEDGGATNIEEAYVKAQKLVQASRATGGSSTGVPTATGTNAAPATTVFTDASGKKWRYKGNSPNPLTDRTPSSWEEVQ